MNRLSRDATGTGISSMVDLLIHQCSILFKNFPNHPPENKSHGWLHKICINLQNLSLDSQGLIFNLQYDYVSTQRILNEALAAYFSIIRVLKLSVIKMRDLETILTQCNPLDIRPENKSHGRRTNCYIPRIQC